MVAAGAAWSVRRVLIELSGLTLDLHGQRSAAKERAGAILPSHTRRKTKLMRLRSPPRQSACPGYRRVVDALHAQSGADLTDEHSGLKAVLPVRRDVDEELVN